MLRSMWAGRIPLECLPDTPEYRRLQVEQTTRSDAFLGTLSKEQIKAVLELEWEGNLIREKDEEALFIHAFRLGALMILDILRP